MTIVKDGWNEFEINGPPPPPERAGLSIEIWDPAEGSDLLRSILGQWLHHTGEPVDGFRAAGATHWRYLNGPPPKPASLSEAQVELVVNAHALRERWE